MFWAYYSVRHPWTTWNMGRTSTRGFDGRIIWRLMQHQARGWTSFSAFVLKEFWTDDFLYWPPSLLHPLPIPAILCTYTTTIPILPAYHPMTTVTPYMLGRRGRVGNISRTVTLSKIRNTCLKFLFVNKVLETCIIISSYHFYEAGTIIAEAAGPAKNSKQIIILTSPKSWHIKVKLPRVCLLPSVWPKEKQQSGTSNPILL